MPHYIRVKHTNIKSGDKFPFFGRDLTLEITHSLNKPAIRIGADKLAVNIYAKGDEPDMPLLLAACYRIIAMKYIAERAKFWAAAMGTEYGRVTVKDQSSRWGSCSAKKNINFNWRLVMMPPAILDYVVIHELAHLKELNHSPAFWQIVAQHDSYYAAHRQWLKSTGNDYFKILPAK